MAVKNTSKRAASGRVRVIPKCRVAPDVEKLARAMLAIAKSRAEQGERERQVQKTTA